MVGDARMTSRLILIQPPFRAAGKSGRPGGAMAGGLAGEGDSAGVPPLMAALRAATAEHHEALHVHPFLFGLTDGSLSLSHYAEILVRFLAVHRVVDGRVTGPWAGVMAGLGLPLVSRCPMIERDLKDLAGAGAGAGGLALPPPVCPTSDLEDDMPRADNAASAAGILYVMEGSRLGGQVLARGMRQGLPEPLREAVRFFGSADLDVGLRWQQVAAALGNLDRTPAARRTMVQAAVGTFAALKLWFDRELDDNARHAAGV